MYIVSSGMKCKFYQIFRNKVYRFQLLLQSIVYVSQKDYTIEIGSKNYIMIYENIRSILVLAFQVVSKRDIYLSLYARITALSYLRFAI